MRKELLEKREELLKEIQSIDKSLGMEVMREDVERLDEITDILNTLFQDPVVEKYSSEASELLYRGMQILDRIWADLQEDLMSMEIEKENKF